MMAIQKQSPALRCAKQSHSEQSQDKYPTVLKSGPEQAVRVPALFILLPYPFSLFYQIAMYITNQYNRPAETQNNLISKK